MCIRDRTESLDVNAGENTAHLECPMSFFYDVVNSHRSKAKSTKMIPLSELFALDVGDFGANDTHKKQNIISAVKDAYSKITALQTSESRFDSDEKEYYRAKAQDIYLKCLETVSKNVANDPP